MDVYTTNAFEQFFTALKHGLSRKWRMYIAAARIQCILLAHEYLEYIKESDLIICEIGQQSFTIVKIGTSPYNGISMIDFRKLIEKRNLFVGLTVSAVSKNIFTAKLAFDLQRIIEGLIDTLAGATLISTL